MIAKKINISEVTFLNLERSKFFIRWFSPTQEVDICGHGTIAGFKILKSMNLFTADESVEIQSSKYNFKLKSNMDLNTISLQLPIFSLQKKLPNELNNIIDVSLIERVSSSYLDYIVELDSLSKLKKININFSELLKVKKRGLIVTYAEIAKNEIFFRYFCPKLGFNEDPGTGSALSSLYSFWNKRLDFDKKISFSQESERKSRGFVQKLVNDDFITIQTFVSSHYTKTIEID
tara:strand:+ start:2091 stop:2789 length:699 start_codon:yes stop_codon:yes gene_type:complete